MRISYCKISRFAAFAAFTFLVSWKSLADSPNGYPFEGLAREVTVRGYPVPEDTSTDFSERHRATLLVALKEALAARGLPLIQDGTVEEGHVRLVYGDALVVISGRYSNNIVCRVEVPVSKLNDGFDSALVTSLAARSCRAAEERGWRETDLNLLHPVGIDTLPGTAASKVAIYTTDDPYLMFFPLLRNAEKTFGHSASLVRGPDRDDPYQQEGSTQWRYAWFANRNILAVRYKVTPRDGLYQTIGFVCTLEAPVSTLQNLDGTFATWCDHQEERLRPGLDSFIKSTVRYRNNYPPRAGGFHAGLFSQPIIDSYWKTGTVTDSLPQ
jgi:hypothetical protein